MEKIVEGTVLQSIKHPEHHVTVTRVRPSFGQQRALYEIGWGFDPTHNHWLEEDYLRSAYIPVANAGDSSDAPDLEPAGDAAPSVGISLLPLMMDLQVKGMVDALKNLGFTVEPPAEPAPREMIHNWDGENCPVCGSVWPAADLTYWVTDDCGRCGAEMTLVYYLASIESPGGGEALAQTTIGDLIANAQEIRTKLYDLHDELESSGQSYWRAIVQWVIALLPENQVK